MLLTTTRSFLSRQLHSVTCRSFLPLATCQLLPFAAVGDTHGKAHTLCSWSLQPTCTRLASTMATAAPVTVAPTTTTTTGPAAPDLGGISWQQTMYRIRDPAASVPFYEKNFGFTLMAQLDFPQWKFSLFFMGIPPKGTAWPSDPKSKEAEAALWTYDGVLLELTHNHGTETDADFKPYNNGNVEPHRGFGHIAVMTKDVYKASEELEKNGVGFKKKPNEGRMKGLAFALDPDGYWIEIIRGNVENYTLAQTMLRVKDPVKSLDFYQTHFNMSLVAEKHFSDFSLFFLASVPAGMALPKDPKDRDESSDWMRNWDGCVLELTHNHGTEKDDDFSYHNGNTDPRGFGHIGFLVPDVYEISAKLEKAGVEFQKKPDDGTMKGLAFAKDPDGYWIEIIKRGGSARAADAKKDTADAAAAAADDA